MFKRSDEPSIDDEIAFTWNGREVSGHTGDTVASALLAIGMRANRTHPVTNEPRGPYCMMGVCFECLVEIDGVPNRQACQVKLGPAMQVMSQRGARA